MSKKRLLTGIKPTGDIHLGNYVGAIRQIVDLQDEYECFVFVADIHALNQGISPAEMHAFTLGVTRAYLACGVDPAKVTLFKQSAISEHGQLAQIIGAQVGLGYLERSHAYKDALANGKTANLGLFSYPILMSADILLYSADVVPVGKDQYQHLEIARDLAQQHNSRTSSSCLVMPQTLESNYPTLLGTDGRKMSKSYNNVLGLFEDADSLTKKIMHIVTDSKMPEERKNTADTIGVLFKAVSSDEEFAEFSAAYAAGGMGYKEAKEMLAKKVLHFVEDIQQKNNLLTDAEVEGILADGAKKAKPIAEACLLRVRQSLGMEV